MNNYDGRTVRVSVSVSVSPPSMEASSSPGGTHLIPFAPSRRLVPVIVLSLAICFVGTSCAQQQAGEPPAARAITPPVGVDKYVSGVRAYRANDKDKAVADLEAATQLNPKLTMARALLGDLYKERGDYTK